MVEESVRLIVTNPDSRPTVRSDLAAINLAAILAAGEAMRNYYSAASSDEANESLGHRHREATRGDGMTDVTMSYQDAAREFDKAAGVLRAVERYLVAYNESMAALHMSEKVMASPLTAAVQNAALDAERAAERFSGRA